MKRKAREREREESRGEKESEEKEILGLRKEGRESGKRGKPRNDHRKRETERIR